jgi:hypothetical protein
MSDDSCARPEYIDYTVFLGMNAAEPSLRLRCKALLVSRLRASLLMTWDHVGRCDDVIWKHSRVLQDHYYPFMDALHSCHCLQREGYQDGTLRLATADHRLQDLPVLQRLLLARAIEQGALVYTLNPALLTRPELPVRAPAACEQEPDFPAWLESLYRSSLQLRIPMLDREGA